jgi:hypothetical protein
MTDDTQLADSPLLSVIVATPDNYATVRQLVRYLAQQTIRERLEIVFVAPSSGDAGLDESELTGFHSYVLLETGLFRSLNHARVAGIRIAKASIVVLTEDHCFPAPEWAEALVAAHQGSWAGVGAAVGLANIHSTNAWANYLIQYAPWIKPATAGAINDIAGHNSSYKKDILLSYGDDLEPMMDFEFTLHQDLQEKGYQLYLEPKAEMYHLFITCFRAAMAEHFNIGQLLAASRAPHFAFARRFFALLTVPLLPAVRMYRILRLVHHMGWSRKLLPGILPWLIFMLAVSAFGELAGYTIGKGKVQARTIDLDFHRERFVSEKERRRIWGEDLVDFAAMPVDPTMGSAGK